VGHLKNGDDEKGGSDAYVPPEPAKDTQLAAAISLLHGAKPESLKTSDANAKVQ
jgi:carboxyl-terminal processing protease